MRLSVRSRRSRHEAAGLGFIIPVPTAGKCPQGGGQGLPGSRATHCPYALFFDPGRTENARPLRRVGAAPAMSTAKAPTNLSSFRGSIARLGDLLFTLRPTRYHGGRKTRFRLPAKLYRTGLDTRRVATNGF